MLNIQKFLEETDREFEKRPFVNGLDEIFGDLSEKKRSLLIKEYENIKSFYHTNRRALLEEVEREAREIVEKHNVRILNEFQLQGKPDMPMIAYDERVCLIPAMKKATEETLSSLASHLREEIIKTK